MYKRSSEVERLFPRLRRCYRYYRYYRIVSRFEELEVMFLGFVSPALEPTDFACVERT
jgi:hypothetical protein